MRQKPIIFTMIFKVRVADREQTITTIGGLVDVKVGDYLFEHPDGTVSRVSPENIGNFEVVEKTSEACEYVQKRENGK